MGLRFTNTLGGAKQDFVPIEPGKVGIYVCGPTVYDTPHIGNARPAVVFDVLRRYLQWRGHDVFFVRNITDVDDKLINKANDLGTQVAVVAERFAREYEDVMGRLRVLPPDVAPRASAHIPEMIEMISRLEERGLAYAGEGSVYFSVEKFDGYGKLSGRTLDDLANRERVEPAPGKLHPLDFALWKAAKPGEPFWSSPWGPGRPGWHIECSAMSARYLGQPFDIHGGGSDLIFPHHENEIAQSEGSHDSEFARYWLHNGHINIRGEKMSKSLRNYMYVGEVLADHPAEVLRLFIVGAHYRSQIDYSPESLDEAKAVWERFRAFLRIAPSGNRIAPSGDRIAPSGDRIASAGDVDDEGATERLSGFVEAMDDDLNTPGALAALHELVREGHAALDRGDAAAAAAARAAVVTGLEVLGCDPDEGGRDLMRLVGPLVELLLEQRQAARAEKDFARADEIRERLDGLGVAVEDSPDGARWFLR